MLRTLRILLIEKKIKYPNAEITKEMLEKKLGYEINQFELEAIY